MVPGIIVNGNGNVFSVFLGGVLIIGLVTAVGMHGTQLSKVTVSAGNLGAKLTSMVETGK